MHAHLALQQTYYATHGEYATDTYRRQNPEAALANARENAIKGRLAAQSKAIKNWVQGTHRSVKGGAVYVSDIQFKLAAHFGSWAQEATNKGKVLWGTEVVEAGKQHPQMFLGRTDDPALRRLGLFGDLETGRPGDKRFLQIDFPSMRSEKKPKMADDMRKVVAMHDQINAAAGGSGADAAAGGGSGVDAGGAAGACSDDEPAA